eukprot:TRINITY_DN2401_c0_g1_i1.p1 TRINITY_DN2401_c0_g1~~TRINITY_DN2401_c0_g1_i1.p1  ORF type:complete len:1131 (-),score=277.45 TRINITY_DN2401_c0_g1_i1:174-3566(-)
MISQAPHIYTYSLGVIIVVIISYLASPVAAEVDLGTCARINETTTTWPYACTSNDTLANSGRLTITRLVINDNQELRLAIDKCYNHYAKQIGDAHAQRVRLWQYYFPAWATRTKVADLKFVVEDLSGQGRVPVVSHWKTSEMYLLALLRDWLVFTTSLGTLKPSGIYSRENKFVYLARSDTECAPLPSWNLSLEEVNRYALRELALHMPHVLTPDIPPTVHVLACERESSDLYQWTWDRCYDIDGAAAKSELQLKLALFIGLSFAIAIGILYTAITRWFSSLRPKVLGQFIVDKEYEENEDIRVVHSSLSSSRFPEIIALNRIHQLKSQPAFVARFHQQMVSFVLMLTAFYLLCVLLMTYVRTKFQTTYDLSIKPAVAGYLITAIFLVLSFITSFLVSRISTSRESRSAEAFAIFFAFLIPSWCVSPLALGIVLDTSDAVSVLLPLVVLAGYLVLLVVGADNRMPLRRALRNFRKLLLDEKGKYWEHVDIVMHLPSAGIYDAVLHSGLSYQQMTKEQRFDPESLSYATRQWITWHSRQPGSSIANLLRPHTWDINALDSEESSSHVDNQALNTFHIRGFSSCLFVRFHAVPTTGPAGRVQAILERTRIGEYASEAFHAITSGSYVPRLLMEAFAAVMLTSLVIYFLETTETGTRPIFWPLLVASLLYLVFARRNVRWIDVASPRADIARQRRAKIDDVQRFAPKHGRGRGSGNSSGLIEAMKNSADPSTIADIVNYGYDVNGRDGSDLGMAAIHYAATNGDARAITQLVRAGADPDLRLYTDERSALHLASELGLVQAVSTLCRIRSDGTHKTEDVFDFGPMHAGQRKGTQMRSLVSSSASDSSATHASSIVSASTSSSSASSSSVADDGGSTLTSSGSEDSSDELDEEIVERINAGDIRGWTPLHCAAANAYRQSHVVCKVLLAHGAEPDTPLDTPSADTPLTLAAAHGNWKNIQVLLRFGADINGSNGFGETPIFLTARGGHLKATRELLLYALHAGIKLKGIKHAEAEAYKRLLALETEPRGQMLIMSNGAMRTLTIRDQQELVHYMRQATGHDSEKDIKKALNLAGKTSSKEYKKITAMNTREYAGAAPLDLQAEASHMDSSNWSIDIVGGDDDDDSNRSVMSDSS